MDFLIRSAKKSDCAAISAIYRPYVEQTAITFEYEPPDEAEFVRRMTAVQEHFPYLVAEDAHGTILGYAYAGRFHPRAAYSWCAEPSIYVRMDQRRRGIGSALYRELEQRLIDQNVASLIALVADVGEEDEHLTHDSVLFHTRAGYRELGRYPQCGYKFEHWYDLVWLEKELKPRTIPQPPVLPPIHDSL